ncbi:DDE_Tnp_IS1595 domain-containing protein, partial [Trichonephila inaurata madagascariensis]
DDKVGFFLVDGEKKRDLWPRIARHCNPETSVICTDSATQYHNVNKLFNDALHKTTNHKKGEFVNKTDKLNIINPLENENRNFKKSIINRKSEKSIRQYMALHFYRRTRLNTLKSLDAKVQMFLEDISWVFPGYGKEGLQLRKLEVSTVESEGISDMVPKTFNKNLLNGITFYIFFKKTLSDDDDEVPFVDNERTEIQIGKSFKERLLLRRGKKPVNIYLHTDDVLGEGTLFINQL